MISLYRVKSKWCRLFWTVIWLLSIYKGVKGKQGKYLRDLVTVSCKGDPESYHPDPMHIKRG